MYDLSKRLLTQPAKHTPAEVGPQTYYLEEDKILKKCGVPFLSCTARDYPPVYRTSSTNALYGVHIPQRIKGGSSLKNRSERFVYKSSDTPGPATYDVKKPGDKRTTIKPTDGIETPRPKKLYVCRVPYSINAVGKSIPTSIDSNGYYVTEQDDLVKLPEDDNDQTLGPAFYNIPPKDCLTTRTYHRGNGWSLSRTARDSFQIQPGPGPGHYNVLGNGPNPRTKMYEEYREMASRFAFMPRYTELHAIQEIQEDKPAPNHYDIERGAKIKAVRSRSIKPRPFVAAEPRNAIRKTVAPGPTDYDVSFVSQTKRSFSTQNAPFRVLSSRFKRERKSPLPGPATYHYDDSMSTKLLKKKRNDLVPFNNTSRRKLTTVPRDAYETPSAAQYLVEPLESETKPCECSHFKSKTLRTKDRDNKYCVEVASYNISEPFNAMRDKTSHYVGFAPFYSTRKRSGDSFFSTSANPGPADYLSQSTIGGRACKINMSPRFREPDENVGPASYTLHPKFASSLYHANSTQNLRLKEFLLRKKLKLPPKLTWKRWCEKVKKRKVMLWFHNFDKIHEEHLNRLRISDNWLMSE